VNYPVWQLDSLGGGSLIALIAVLHTYVAQFAVGGGIFLWLTDRLATRRGDDAMLDWVQRHTKFFLLLTMVYGGVTGVGIWFSIGLVNPGGTSLLIHSFVFGWATEWVFFALEIGALLVYHYRFRAMTAPTRHRIAGLYAFAAWGSLFIIVGILSFMLTPGAWRQTHGFWDGFFNPSFWSSVAYRTAGAITLAGIFGLVSAVFGRDADLRARFLRYSVLWILVGAVAVAGSGLWYLHDTEAALGRPVGGFNPETVPYIQWFFVGSVVAVVGALALIVRTPRPIQMLLTAIVVVGGVGWHGGFEYLREASRRPFVIQDVLYTTQVRPEELPTLRKDGILAHAKWVRHHEITPDNRLEVGRDLFDLTCLACHTIGGPRDILPRVASLTHPGLRALVAGIGKVHPYMPPFPGTEAEMDALAAFLALLGGKPVDPDVDRSGPLASVGASGWGSLDEGKTPLPPRVPLAEDGDDYLLLAWNDLGMHCVSDSAPWFLILPPANTLEAQLLKRGDSPELVTEGVTLHYAVDDGWNRPSSQVRFWDYAKVYTGADIPEDIGLGGAGLEGKLAYDEAHSAFVVEKLPVVGYKDDGAVHPYPMFTVEARDEASGGVLARTRVVAPTSTEMRCLTCHGGDWGHAGGAGLGDETAQNILRLHDRDHGTTLWEDAKAGKPAWCQSCHADVAIGAKGEDGVLSLSAAIHGWHANYMDKQDAASCQSCHPANPRGSTRCMRGVHNRLGLTCVDCHGTLQEHAAGLLAAEADKPAAKQLLAHLEPTHVASIQDIEPRRAWLQEPHCLACHEDFQRPERKATAHPSAAVPTRAYHAVNGWNDKPSGLYRMQTDEAGLRCEACHGSTHALYPALNPYEAHRDSYQPLSLSGMPYPLGSNDSCEVCHATEMEDPIHHEHMQRSFRNQQLWKGSQKYEAPAAPPAAKPAEPGGAAKLPQE